MTAKKKPEDLKKNQKPKTEKPTSKPGAKEETKIVEAKKPEKKSNVVDRPTVEILPVKLTETEVNQFARESAQLHGERDGIELEKKGVMTGFKSRIEAVSTRIAELNRKISSGTENRQVACFWRHDYDTKKKTLFRVSISAAEGPEEITTYAMSIDELQRGLPPEFHPRKIDEKVADQAKTGSLTATIAEALAATVPAPGDPTGTDDVRTPAAENPEETKVRKWFNAQDVEGRKKIFCGPGETELLSDDRTKLPYKRLPESDREIIRKAHAVSAIPF